MAKKKEFGLGRVAAPDIRDQEFLLKKAIKMPPSKFTARYWPPSTLWWGDQGETSQCVGYSFAHWLTDGPVTHGLAAPVVKPIDIYAEAQKIDEWPGENYDGTSVRAGVKTLQNKGYVTSYYWAFDIDTLVYALLELGPVVVGTNWFNNMFYPAQNGMIKVGGALAGGHAYMINGVNTTKKLFRIKNSWGKEWGIGGMAYISFADMARLIAQQGEVCIAVEKKLPTEK